MPWPSDAAYQCGQITEHWAIAAGPVVDLRSMVQVVLILHDGHPIDQTVGQLTQPTVAARHEPLRWR